MHYNCMEDEDHEIHIHGLSSSGRGRLENLSSEISTATMNNSYRRPSNGILLLFFLGLLVGAFLTWDQSIAVRDFFLQKEGITKNLKKPGSKITYQLNCSNGTLTETCPANNLKTFEPRESSSEECPEYFRWIHEDLRPWKETGISRDALERATEAAHFRLVIVDGKAYLQKFRNDVYQTRDVFTLWGILQLLRLYPGMVPDLELIFLCHDRPIIKKADYQGPNATSPPPLFRYCNDDRTLDIVFPDWTFWGWAETNIKPWTNILEELKEGNKMMEWKDRVPLAYWRGNPHVAPTREDILKCNVSEKSDWNTRIYWQNWKEEAESGYKDSDLKNQCTHRYKIYIEGLGWSVSDKYIIACDAMTLLVKPQFYDFMLRGLVPMKHYWPIRSQNKCKDIKFAVEWGNNHTREAEAIGEMGSKFIQENVKMEYVYSYMLHVLTEYAKLLRFKPAITPHTQEICQETLACPALGRWEKFLADSRVESPSDSLPCKLPPPYEPEELRSLIDERESVIRTVESWGDQFWHKNQ